MENLFQYILDQISEINPMHGKKLKKSVKSLGQDYFNKAEEFYQKYNRILMNRGKSIDFAIDCYLHMCNDMMFEQLRFLETGKYSNSSFDEVNKNVYDNPEVMEYHMNGLLMSEMLWHHHYKVYSFFKENFKAYILITKKYLEIGGGHGLFTQEAVNDLLNADIDVVDISKSSIELSKQFVEGGDVNYYLKDVFEYNSQSLYDFIVMGEVLEHVEDPIALLKKLNSLLNENGRVFITTPTNAPTIDHVYLFRTREDIAKIINKAGFEIEKESCIYAEDLPAETAEEMKITMMYAAFLKKK